MAFRRFVKDSQLPCTPAVFKTLPTEKQKELLGKLSLMRQALLRGFRSVGEMRFNDQLCKHGVIVGYEDQARKVQYTVPAVKKWYLCDFFLPKLDGGIMHIDFKGVWSAQDREKFLLLKQQYPAMDLRLVFQGDPYKMYIGSTKTTSYADICTAGKGTGKWKELELPFAHLVIPDAWLAELARRSDV